MGTFRYLERLMAEHAAKVLSSDDPDVIATFVDLSARLANALEFERANGDGSLIDLADPLVDNLVRRGIEITSDQVAAAKRHQYAGYSKGSFESVRSTEVTSVAWRHPAGRIVHVLEIAHAAEPLVDGTVVVAVAS